MSRPPELSLLSPPEALAAAKRVLAHPTYAVQRVALNEIYTFAVAMEHFTEVSVLAAAQLRGAASPDDLARLRTLLLALGILAPSFSPPVQEPSNGQA